MRIFRVMVWLVTASLLWVGAATAFGQNGTLDQESPKDSAWLFQGGSVVWQQQVRVGLEGQLEGISLYLKGTPGVSQTELSIGMGDVWSADFVFTTMVTMGAEEGWQFIEMTNAGIFLEAGQTFVIQLIGNDTGLQVWGSNPLPPDPPLYAEPLWMNEANRTDQARMGFRSYRANACLRMEVGILSAGQVGIWTISGAVPASKGVLVYGFAVGRTAVSGAGGYCATFGIDGITPRKVLGFYLTDAAGNATVEKFIPRRAGGRQVFTQGALRDTCPEECLSEVVLSIII